MILVMTKRRRSLLAGFVATMAVLTMAVLTLKFSLVGFIGASLIIAGVIELFVEAENVYVELREQARFSLKMRQAIANFMDNLADSPTAETAALINRLKNQCQRADNLDKTWEQIVSGDEKVRLREIDDVVRFEEAFSAYLDDLVQMARTSSTSALENEMTKGRLLILSFEHYLLELSIQLEMG